MYNNSGWSIPTTLGMVRYLLVFSGELIGVIAGTKNVAKQLHRICASTVRTRDRTWFTELFDKGMYFLDILIIHGISGYFHVCMFCVCDVNVCDCVSFMCISAFHM